MTNIIDGTKHWLHSSYLSISLYRKDMTDLDQLYLWLYDGLKIYLYADTLQGLILYNSYLFYTPKTRGGYKVHSPPPCRSYTAVYAIAEWTF